MSESKLIHYSPTKIIKPEDITEEDLRALSNDSFPIWCLTSGAKVDGYDVEFNKHRYLLPIYMDNSQVIVWQKAAQLGATIFLLLRVLWWLYHNQGRKAGLYFPTKEGVDNLSKDRLTPLIESVPDILDVYDSNDKLGLRRIGKSSFYLMHLGGTASKDSVPLDLVAFDEVRLVRAQDIDQALERISHSPHKFEIYMSTAGMPGLDIAARFDRGTRHIWRSKCGCFSYDTRIWVRNSHTKEVSCKSFSEIQDTWESYEALSKGPHKRLQFKPITAFHHNGVKDTVSVLFRNGQSVRCTPDHEFFRQKKGASNSRGRISPIEIGQVPLDNVYKNKLLCAHQVPTHRTPQVPLDNDTLFVLGAYIAEGSVPNTNMIDITQSKDTPIRTRVPEWAKSNNLPCQVTDTCLRVSLASRPDLEALFQQCGRGCENKQVPDFLMSMTPSQVKPLLEGYLAGDGHDERHRTQDLEGYASNAVWSCVTTSETLASQIQELCLKQGTPVYTSRSYPVGKKPTWIMEYNPGSTFGRGQVGGDFSHVSVRSRVLATAIPVCDITVQDNHNYVLASGLLVHNCTDGVDLARTFPDCVINSPKHGLQLQCPKCRFVVKDPQNGRYVPENPSGEYNSYHVSQLASKYMPLKRLMDSYNHTTNMSEFYNAKLGLPFIDAANQGVGLSALKDCVDPELVWGRDESKDESRKCAMGVDVGAGYAMVTIMDYNRSGRRRLRHVEIVEQENPDYYENGAPVSPFKRLHQLMEQYNVKICVCDAMPNADLAMQFQRAFPGRVYLAFYLKGGRDPVTWGDRGKMALGLSKAGPLMKSKYKVVLDRFISISNTLGVFRDGEISVPEPQGLVQMARVESGEGKGQLAPEAVCDRLFDHLTRAIRKTTVLNDETQEVKYEWTYAKGDPHLMHSANYCMAALDRMGKGGFNFSFV